MSLFKRLASCCGALAIVTVALTFGLPAGQANAGCEDPKNAFDDVYCYSKLYIDADTELNKVYGTLSELLSKQERAVLKKSELAWIRARNAKCSRQEGEDNFVDMECAVAETRERMIFFEDRVAECQAGKCDTAKLED
jgi:uncharacterized protein YecT (DUF1311 family)